MYEMNHVDKVIEVCIRCVDIITSGMRTHDDVMAILKRRSIYNIMRDECNKIYNRNNLTDDQYSGLKYILDKLNIIIEFCNAVDIFVN